MLSYTTLLIIVALAISILTTVITLSTTEFHSHIDPDRKFHLSTKNSQYRRGFKVLLFWFSHNRNRIVPYSLFLMIFFSIGQIILVSFKERSDKQENDLESNLRDSTIAANIRHGVRESSNELYKSLSEALKKRELLLDTLNDQLVKLRDKKPDIIRDSANNEVPYVYFSNNAIQRGEEDSTFQELIVSFSSGSAEVKITEIEAAVFAYDQDKEISFRPPFKWLTKSTLMPSNYVFRKRLILPPYNYSFLIIPIKIKLSAPSNKNIYELFYLVRYAKSENLTLTNGSKKTEKEFLDRLGWSNVP